MPFGRAVLQSLFKYTQGTHFLSMRSLLVSHQKWNPGGLLLQEKRTVTYPTVTVILWDVLSTCVPGLILLPCYCRAWHPDSVLVRNEERSGTLCPLYPGVEVWGHPGAGMAPTDTAGLKNVISHVLCVSTRSGIHMDNTSKKHSYCRRSNHSFQWFGERTWNLAGIREVTFTSWNIK